MVAQVRLNILLPAVVVAVVLIAALTSLTSPFGAKAAGGSQLIS